jgi:hypothetical protein
MAITLQQAKNLKYGDILYHAINKNKKGEKQRWRVNGKVKLWKTRPNEIRIPLKHGLYAHDYLTHNDLHLVDLNE